MISSLKSAFLEFLVIAYVTLQVRAISLRVTVQDDGEKISLVSFEFQAANCLTFCF